MRSKLGTVVHQVTSDEGTCTFPATEQWEAVEVAPGGYEGAKEAIPERMFRKFRGAFKRGAVFRSFLEQTGDCIFGGELTDDPIVNDGRLDIAVSGWAKRLEQKAGRLLYMTQDITEWSPTHQQGTADPPKWSVRTDNDALVGLSPSILFTRDKYNDTDGAAYGTAQWESDNHAYGQRAVFNSPGFDGLKRLRAYVEAWGQSLATRPSACKLTVEVNVLSTADVFVLDSGDENYIDVDLQSGVSEVDRVVIQAGDILDTDADLIAKYGSWPAFRPSGATNDYDTWIRPLDVRIDEIRLYGIATDDEMTVSAGVRDIASRAGVSDLQVAEFGYNMLPADFKDGMTYAEVLAYLGMLANARSLMLDTGTRPYLEFDRFSKRIWTPDKHQHVEALPLPRCDRVDVQWRSSNGRSTGWAKVIADVPFEKPKSFGRVAIADRVTSAERAEVIGGRILEHVGKRRLGGSFEGTHVTDEDGRIRSMFLLHAGDMMRDQERSGRGRIARKTMTIRGVSGEFEANYAPLDRVLELASKRLSRSAA